MLNAFTSLVHSPYNSSGGGEIYQVSNENLQLQRSALNHIDFALEVGEEYIGYWNLRKSAEDLNLSPPDMRNSIFRMLDEAFDELIGFPDYPSPSANTTRKSSLRPLLCNCQVNGLLRRVWTMLASLPGIVMEQGRFHLVLRLQLRTLVYILTFDAETFDAVMDPDHFDEQVPTSLVLLARNLHCIGAIHASRHVFEFLLKDFAAKYPVVNFVQQAGQMMYQDLLEDIRGSTGQRSTDDEPTMEHIMEALRFERSSKHEDDPPEQMNLIFESAKILANSFVKREDFASAKALFKTIREKRKDALPSGQADYFVSCQDLGNCLRLSGAITGEQDDLQEAMKLLEEAMKGLRSLFGEEDYRTVRSLTLLGSICNYRGEYQVAEEYLSRVSILYKSVDANPGDKIGCQEKLADARFGLERFAMAEHDFFYSWYRTVKILSFDHSHSLQLLANWAICLLRLGKITPALLLLFYVLETKMDERQFDRTTQRAWSYLAKGAKLLEEANSPSKAEAVRAMKRRYDACVIQSLIAKGSLFLTQNDADNAQGIDSDGDNAFYFMFQ
jgi:Tetratricopeptide repeat